MGCTSRLAFKLVIMPYWILLLLITFLKIISVLPSVLSFNNCFLSKRLRNLADTCIMNNSHKTQFGYGNTGMAHCMKLKVMTNLTVKILLV
jgi:hypothetical protein